MTSIRLPGLAVAMSVRGAADGYGRSFGLIEVPSTGHFSAVLQSARDGAALSDPGEVDQWVAHWGAWLASLAHESGIVAAAVSVEAVPDAGRRLADEMTTHARPESPLLARQVLEVVRQYPPCPAQVTARICVTYSAVRRTGARRRSRDEMAAELGARLPGLSAQLGLTGVGGAAPMTERRIAEMVRVAYDPSVHNLIAQASRGSGLTWADARPAVAQETIASYRHDSAASITWGMSPASGDKVLANAVAGLLAPHRVAVRKRITILYRPSHPAADAQITRRDRSRAFGLSATEPANDTASQQTARKEASGSGFTRFGMLVTATVESDADLPLAAAAVDVLAPAERIQLRRMYGMQATAFAAALPIGIVLPDHLTVPKFIREVA